MMKRILFVMFVMGLAGLMTLPILKAQDEPTPTALCSLETVQTVTNAMAELITLAQMDNAAGDLRIQCSGLVFEGANADVIGPVTIPAGTYIATAKTEGFMIVTFNVLSGECGQGTGSFLGRGLFSISRDEATNGAETVMSSTGCQVLIEVSNVQAAWTLTFEQVQ
jgi:hypothetical protein